MLPPLTRRLLPMLGRRLVSLFAFPRLMCRTSSVIRLLKLLFVLDFSHSLRWMELVNPYKMRRVSL